MRTVSREFSKPRCGIHPTVSLGCPSLSSRGSKGWFPSSSCRSILDVVTDPNANSWVDLATAVTEGTLGEALDLGKLSKVWFEKISADPIDMTTIGKLKNNLNDIAGHPDRLTPNDDLLPYCESESNICHPLYCGDSLQYLSSVLQKLEGRNPSRSNPSKVCFMTICVQIRGVRGSDRDKFDSLDRRSYQSNNRETIEPLHHKILSDTTSPPARNLFVDRFSPF